MELLTPASSEGQSAWWNTHRNWFRFYSYEYNPLLRQYVLGIAFRAVYALVESNERPIERYYDIYGLPFWARYSTIRIVWMNTLNGGIGENSFTYTPFNIRFPFMKGTATVVRFLANTLSPILTKNNTLLFPVQFVTTENKFRSSVMYYRPYDTKWNIGGLTEEGTYNPAILEWENDKLVMIAQHDSGYYRVYESTDLGDTWKESTNTLSRVWVNSLIQPGRGTQNNFITATIDNKSVILFTQSLVYGAQNVFYLWLTDNTHIYYVGFIATDYNATTSTLLLKDGKLSFRYETGQEEGYGVLFVDLTTAMESIKSAVKKWTEQDQTLTESRCCTDETCISSGQCEDPVSTTGLVGYLSGNIDEERKWRDEYLCVNAFVSGTTMKVSNGLTFKGLGAGAIWPVSINGPARPYHFTNYAFTLAATVTIHEVPNNDSSPLLGVSLKNSKKEILLGVSYTNESKWSTINRETTGKSTGTWELNNKYSVILTFENGKLSVYINSTRLDVGTDLRIAANEEISHFYFGEYSESRIVGSNVNDSITVKDVMLYNRVLNDTEIAALHRNKMKISFAARNAEETLKEIQERRNIVKSSPLQATETPQDTTSQNTTSTPTETTIASAPVKTEPITETATQTKNDTSVTEISPTEENNTAVTATAQTQENQHSTRSAEEQLQNKAPEALNESTHAEPSEQLLEKEKNTALTPISNEMQQDLLQNTTQSMINNNVSARQNEPIDGTVRIYESVLPMLLLGLWALATVFP